MRLARFLVFAICIINVLALSTCLADLIIPPPVGENTQIHISSGGHGTVEEGEYTFAGTASREQAIAIVNRINQL